ncbi:YggL family protein [Diaphorobacter sp.]|uniref:YggL 50S ribosome-binding family protein n=1 Tax=Diaphorobacter sp. TaxID=1934310 RepID=UPI0028ACBBEC|nr:YggL family protein [Diaphorobacter sp.]
MSLPLKRQRSRRLRKKMRIDEFQELGFEYEVTLDKPLPDDEQEAIVEKFLLELIMPRNLVLGGWVREGFITAFPRGSTTEEDRTAVQEWLQQNIKGATVNVGPLQDAWYVVD